MDEVSAGAPANACLSLFENSYGPVPSPPFTTLGRPPETTGKQSRETWSLGPTGGEGRISFTEERRVKKPPRFKT